MKSGVLQLKTFFVFACPKCHNFTNAPVNQKRRRCSYCGHIIDISKAQRALFESPETAQLAVKEFNAARGGDEFEKAVKRSREKILSLVPDESIRSHELVDDADGLLRVGKQKRLLGILEKIASDEQCTLDELERHCKEYQLDWAWVEEHLTKLANQGILIFPRPWTVKLVKVSKEKKDSDRSVDVSKEILSLLREKEREMRIVDIIRHFEEEGISESAVVASLEKLMRIGDIYEPKTGIVCVLLEHD